MDQAPRPRIIARVQISDTQTQARSLFDLDDGRPSTVRLRVPVARLDDALALMADVALRPDFPQAELARLRKEALTDLLRHARAGA